MGQTAFAVGDTSKGTDKLIEHFKNLKGEVDIFNRLSSIDLIGGNIVHSTNGSVNVVIRMKNSLEEDEKEYKVD